MREASATIGVMMRHAMRQAWHQLGVKLATLFALLPLVIAVALVALATLVTHAPPDASRSAFNLARAELWTSALFLTTAGGAGAVANDLAHRAYIFYFSKPLLPWHYLTGRIAGIFALLALVLTIPPLLLAIVSVGLGSAEHWLRDAGVILPAIVFGLFAALALATASVSISALSSTKATTTAAWLSVFLLPHVLALTVEAAAKFPYLRVFSLTALLTTVAEGLFAVAPDTPGQDHMYWYQALPLLLLYLGFLLSLAHRRLQSAEAM